MENSEMHDTNMWVIRAPEQGTIKDQKAAPYGDTIWSAIHFIGLRKYFPPLRFHSCRERFGLFTIECSCKNSVES